MSDDVQQPAPDEAKNTHGVAEPDDTESHGYRKISNPATPEAPGPDGGVRPRFLTGDDSDDVEGHKKHIR